MRALVFPLLAVFFGAVVACEPVDQVTYTRDVKPILDARCIGCHAEGGIGPFALDTYAGAEPMKEMIVDAVETGRMPPWLAGPGCSDYENDPTPTDDEKAILRAWLDDGAPEGDPADARPPENVVEQAQLARIDLELPIPEPYVPRPDVRDDYRCFLLEWPENRDRFVTGLGVVPGDTRVVHHVIAYVVYPDDMADVQADDDTDEGPGWSCFGGPSNASDGLGGWAPGTPPRQYPPGTGILVPAGGGIILEMHYHAPGIDALDQTTITLQLEDQVEKRAAIIPITNPVWVDSGAMLIPAGDPSVTHSVVLPLDEFVDEPFLIYDASPHMHKRGVAQYMWIERESGEQECVLDVPRWDFDWQLTYILNEPKVVNPTDKLGITCIWDNSESNQPPDDDQGMHDITWGEGTGDEMCIGFYFVTNL